jgi:hypothetical protein
MGSLLVNRPREGEYCLARISYNPTIRSYGLPVYRSVFPTAESPMLRYLPSSSLQIEGVP